MEMRHSIPRSRLGNEECATLLDALESGEIDQRLDSGDADTEFSRRRRLGSDLFRNGGLHICYQLVEE